MMMMASMGTAVADTVDMAAGAKVVVPDTPWRRMTGSSADTMTMIPTMRTMTRMMMMKMMKRRRRKVKQYSINTMTNFAVYPWKNQYLIRMRPLGNIEDLD